MGCVILTPIKTRFKIGGYRQFKARWSNDPTIPQPKGPVYSSTQLMDPREVPFGIVPIGTDTRTPGYTGRRQGGRVRNIRPHSIGRR